MMGYTRHDSLEGGPNYHSGKFHHYGYAVHLWSWEEERTEPTELDSIGEADWSQTNSMLLTDAINDLGRELGEMLYLPEQEPVIGNLEQYMNACSFMSFMLRIKELGGKWMKCTIQNNDGDVWLEIWNEHRVWALRNVQYGGA